jgi:RNA-directed DNA polymerase
MASHLGLTTTAIERIARSASYRYKTYLIPKRAGGKREIHHPSKELKALQRWLLYSVIEQLPVHSAATAYRTGRSIRNNAEPHANSRYLVRIDLTNFFPSITLVDISRYIATHATLFIDWEARDIDLFCSIVCRGAALTIGAPTSPALSNAVCYEMDSQIDSLCVAKAITYTRYADDLFFSTNQREVLLSLEPEIEGVLDRLEVPANLKVNPNKTRHASKRGARHVTGLVLGSDGKVHVGRGLKRKIRAMIHGHALLDEAERATLAGLIAYATGIDPQFKNSLILKYGLKAVREALSMPLNVRS